MSKQVVVISREKNTASISERIAAEKKEWRKREAFRKKLLKPHKERKVGNWKTYTARHDRWCKELLSNLKRDMPKLKELLEEISGHWTYEDMVYRFYHQSFKVYHVQEETLKILYALGQLAPKGNHWNEDFLQLLREGTGKVFKSRHNSRWLKETRPMLEAFFHAKYFLEMAVKYGQELKEAPHVLPSGYAGLLYLYGLR